MINFQDTTLDGMKMIFNFNINYYFKRTLFVLDETSFVELVYIAQENSSRDEQVENVKYDTILSQTRELKYSDYPEEFVNRLKSEQTLEYSLPLSLKQIHYIQENYKDDLFVIDPNVLKSIK